MKNRSSSKPPPASRIVRYRIEDLISRITPENLQAPTQWGPARGLERIAFGPAMTRERTKALIEKMAAKLP